eukprot:20235-Heterococcus_DN1.PRE.1
MSEQQYDRRHQQSYMQQPAPPAQNGHSAYHTQKATSTSVHGTGALAQPPVARAMGSGMPAAAASRPTTRTIGN